jgi:hypothetical protein
MFSATLVGILLDHMPQSMQVTGQRSALPPGDSVGTVLNHINPSMAARLGREWQLEPHTCGARAVVDQAAVNQQLQRAACASKVASAASTKVCHGPAFSSMPIKPAEMHGSRRLDLNGASGTPLLPPHERPWPWIFPPAPSGCGSGSSGTLAAYSAAAQPTPGGLVDIFG